MKNAAKATLFCLAWLWATNVSATTYYVSTEGSDSNTGLLAGQAFASIPHALAKAAAGDTISIGDGAYRCPQLNIPPGVSIISTSEDNTKVTLQPNTDMGTDSPFIRLVSANPGSSGQQSISYLTIDGRSDNHIAYQGIEVRNRSHVDIHHLDIRNFYGVLGWNSCWALKVWSSQATPTSDHIFYWSMVNDDMSKSANYPANPVSDFHFFDNTLSKCGEGATSGDRKLSAAIHPWHLYNSSFHGNYIDVSHSPTQGITATSSLLEKVDFYNNIIVGHKTGGYPESSTSKSLYLIELWVLHDCKFYNNKLINGCFSTTLGKNVEWYNNYVDRSGATSPYGIGIEASQVNEAYIHHNKVTGNPDAGGGMGMTIGITKNGRGTVAVHAWGNIFHGNKAHTIQLTSSAIYNAAKVDAYIFNNIIDFTGETGAYSGIDIHQVAPSVYGDIFIKNNIFTNNRGTDIRLTGDMGNLQIENNILYNNAITLSSAPASNIRAMPWFAEYNNDDFSILSAGAPQVNSGVLLDPMYQMGLGSQTYWGTATSRDLPVVALANQNDNGTWEIGPYVYALGTLAPPAAPSGLQANPVSAGGITLSWEDNSDDETGFVVQRSLDGIGYSTVDTVGVNETGYNDAGLLSSTNYYYQVFAYHAGGNSEPSKADAKTQGGADEQELAIIDNTDPGFSVVGTWGTSTFSPGFYGINYRFSNAAAVGTNTAKWTFDITRAGQYEVSVQWPPQSGGFRVKQVQYKIKSGASEWIIPDFNQDTILGNGKFCPLDTVQAEAGQLILEVTSSPTGPVIADAARIRMVETTIPAGVLFTEDFESYAIGTFPSSKWTNLTGLGDWKVKEDGTQALEQSVLSDGHYITVAGEAISDFVFEAKIKVLKVSSASWTGIVGRIVDDKNFYVLWMNGGGALGLDKCVNGNYTTLKTASITYSADKWYTMKLRFEGTNIKAWFEGEEKFNVTDAAIASGKFGIRTSTSAKIDDVLVKDLNTTSAKIWISNDEGIKFYPNPVKDALVISGELSKYSLEVFNVYGRKVHRQENLSGTIVRLDMSGYSPGIYIIKLADGSGRQVVRKIVKE